MSTRLQALPLRPLLGQMIYFLSTQPVAGFKDEETIVRHFLYADRVVLERDVLRLINAVYPTSLLLAGLTPTTIDNWLNEHPKVPYEVKRCLEDLSLIFLHVEYDSLSEFEPKVRQRQEAARRGFADLKAAAKCGEDSYSNANEHRYCSSIVLV